jgi:RNA polymerase sigma factor (sigma-70 family)
MHSSVILDTSPADASCTQSDEHLVIAAKAGDREAFDQLFRRHSKRMLQAILRITKNHEDAEDALQNAFLSAYLHIGSFDGRSKISSWFMRIGINAGLIVLRRHRIRPQISLDHEIADNTRLEDVLCDRRVDIERYCIEREQSLILRRAIAQLRPSLRKILLLQYSLDCSNSELARQTGMTIGAVKTRSFRAKNQLKHSRELVQAARSRKRI